MSNNRDGLSLGCGLTMLGAVFVPMFLLSVGGGIWGWFQIVEQDRVLGMGTGTEATIIHSEVVWHPGRADVPATYEPVIRFSYAVDGTTYESSTVVPGRVDGTHGWAEELVRKHPADQIGRAHV